MDIISKVNQFIYDKSKKDILEELDSIEQADFLHIYMANYNWDNGLDIPRKIIEKDGCELGTALMIFYLADGVRYLENKEEVKNSGLTEWSSFIQELYIQIMNNKFVQGEIFFEPSMSKVQLYKLKKVLQDDEQVFIKECGKKKINISLSDIVK